MTANFSISKLNTYRICGRKHYFSEMGNHGKKNPLKRKAFELKKVQNLQMWQGAVVDLAMEKLIIPLINEKKELDFGEIINQAIEIAKRQYEFSKAKKYKEFSKNNVGDDYCVLEIHELSKPYSEEDILKVYEGIKKSILNISEMQMPDKNLSLLNFLYRAKKLIPNISNWRVEVEDMGVKPQIDLLLYDENFKPTVIDWKVSESLTSDYSRQLEICALTVYLKRLEKIDSPKYDYDDIQLYEVNLWQSKVKKHNFSEAIFHKIYDKIHLSISDIELLDASKEEFRFQEINGHILDLNVESYDITDNSGSCMLCNYNSLCQFLIRNNNQYNEKQYLEFVQNN
jgi:PD-(D/E)XK nuclease superfamily